MAIDTHGWIEFCLSASKEDCDKDYVWMTFMNIQSVVYLNGRLSEFLFGYSRRLISGEFEIQSIAKDRGFPAYPSKSVRDEIKEIEEFELQHGKGDIFGFTHIYYNEVTNLKDLHKFEEPEWIQLFELIDTFKKFKNINDDQIRLVIWFSW